MPAKEKEKFVSISIPEKFLKLYPYAKQAIIFFETHEGKMAPEAIIEFRDALDHLMLAFQNSKDTERLCAETTSALEHLRRASIEPFEWAVENIIANVRDKHRFRIWNKIFLVPAPSRKSYYHLLQDVKKELLAARQCKNQVMWQQGVEHLERAYTIAKEIDNILPEKYTLLSRIFTLLVAIIFFVLGTITC